MLNRSRARATRRLLPILVLFVSCAPVPRPTAHTPARIRILSYNIHHGEGTDGVFDYERLAAVIESARPDLVALQEVDRGTGRASGVDQAAELARLTGLHGFYAMAMPYDGGEYGEAVLSRLPLLESRRIPLAAPDGLEPRAAALVRVRPSATAPEVWFAGTHLDHTRDETTRTEQARQLDEVLRRLDGPIVLAGDLNARPGSGPMQVLLAEWRDACAADPRPTFPSDAPERRIDWVLYRPAARWRVVETRVLEAPVASDHAPLLVVLELR